MSEISYNISGNNLNMVHSSNEIKFCINIFNGSKIF